MKEQKLFKTVFSGYDKKAVEKYIENSEASIQNVLTDSDIKIKQAKMIATVANNEAEQAKNDMKILTTAMEELTKRVEIAENSTKEYADQNIMLKDQIAMSAEEYRSLSTAMTEQEVKYKNIINNIIDENDKKTKELNAKHRSELIATEKQGEQALDEQDRKHARQLAAMSIVCQRAEQIQEDAEKTKVHYDGLIARVNNFAEGLADVSAEIQRLTEKLYISDEE